MINAKQARELAAKNKADNAVKDVETNIKKAIVKGKTEVTFLCAFDLIETITEMLTDSGYRVSPVQGGIKIYWG